MINKSTKYLLSLSIGGLGLLAAPAAFADQQPSTNGIAVTGGSAAGQAAFFVPTVQPTGNVSLFDVNIQTLDLETPNGNTSTAVFVPTAASFKDGGNGIGNGKPDAGDTGTLQGKLSGTAFTAAGVVVPFTGRDAVLNFTLNTFTNNIGNINGTMIRPEVKGAGPLVFLPGVTNATINSDGFVADRGKLQLGDFESTLDAGLIDLPVIFRLGNGQTPDVPTSTLVRRIKFDFEGKDVIPGDGTEFAFLNDDDEDGYNEIRFSGEANKKFQIQSLGTQGSKEFKIQGDIGVVDILIGGTNTATAGTLPSTGSGGTPTAGTLPTTGTTTPDLSLATDDDASTTTTTGETAKGFYDVTVTNAIDETKPLDFKIDGQSEGRVFQYSVNAINFTSTNGQDSDYKRETKFEFKQGDSSFKGKSDGPLAFNAIAGVTAADIEDLDLASLDISNIDLDINAGEGSNCSLCGTGEDINAGDTINIGNINIDINDNDSISQSTIVTVAAQTNSLSYSNIAVDNSRSGFLLFGGGIGNSFYQNNATQVIYASNSYVFSSNTDLFALAGSSSTTTNQYLILVASSEDSYSTEIVNRGSDRYYVFIEDGKGKGHGNGRGHGHAKKDKDARIVVIKAIGPDCRIFPGLVGLREMDDQEVADLDLNTDNQTINDGQTTDDQGDNDQGDNQ